MIYYLVFSDVIHLTDVVSLQSVQQLYQYQGVVDFQIEYLYVIENKSVVLRSSARYDQILQWLNNSVIAKLGVQMFRLLEVFDCLLIVPVRNKLFAFLLAYYGLQAFAEYRVGDSFRG